MSSATASPEPATKNLAIVYGDIAGTSELTIAEGDLAIANILKAFFDRVGHLAHIHHSLTLKFIGDAFLASFENIEDTMPFIDSVQGLLSQEKAFFGRNLAFKFSLHLGEAVYMQTSYGPDVFGENVNIAAQLNEPAERHQLIVSQAALDKLPEHLRARAGASEALPRRREPNPVQFRRIEILLPELPHDGG